MGYLGLLRHREIRALWVAQTFSVIGDRLYALAVMWLVWTMSGSALLVGLVAVVESIPYVLVGVFGRQLLPRCSSLSVLGWLDVARALVVAAVPLAVHAGAGVTALIVGAAVLGVFGAVFDPSFGALVPALVDREYVQPVCGLLDLMSRLARVAGPAVAGLLLLVVGELHLYLLDAGTFAISALVLLRLAHGPLRAAGASASASRVPPAGHAVRAWPLLRHNPHVTLVIAVHGVGLFTATVAAIGMPILLTSRLGAGPGSYAVVITATGAGALAMNPIAGHLPAMTQFPQAYCLAWAINGLALAGMGLAGSLPALIVCAAVGGACGPISAVTMSTHLAHRHTTDERARLLSIDHTVIRACGTAGMLLLPAAAVAAPRLAFTAAGMTAMAVALGALLLAARWQPPALPAAELPAGIDAKPALVPPTGEAFRAAERPVPRDPVTGRRQEARAG